MAPILWLAFACAGDGPVAAPSTDVAGEPAPDVAVDGTAVVEDAPPPPPAVEIVSPIEGERVEAPWIPVKAAATGMPDGTRFEVTLDGQPWLDPDALVRARWAHKGVAVDWISELDTLSVAPGWHELAVTATAPDGTRSASKLSFETTPWPCPVTLSVRDGAGDALGARVVVRSADGPLRMVRGSAKRVDPMNRDGRLDSFLLPEGQLHTRLPHGSWTLVATRGVRHGIDIQELTLDAGCTDTPTALGFTLDEQVPTPGWITADLHVHTGASGDASVPDGARFRSLAAADLDVVVITDHKALRDLSGPLARGAPDLRAIDGVEAKIQTPTGRKYAHINVFPLAQDGPIHGYGKGMAAHIDAWRSRAKQHPVDGVGDRVLIQANHPRGLQTHPGNQPAWGPASLFGREGLTRSVPLGEGSNTWLGLPREGTGTTALDFDLLEVLNRFSWEMYLQVRQDWFLLLDVGRTPTGTGNSDSHALAVELAGMPVNLVESGTGLSDFVDALAGGRVTVSAGPILDLSVRGADGGRVGPGGTVRGREVTVEVKVRAARWIPAGELRLVQDGEVVHRQDLPHPLPAAGVTVTLPRTFARDGWLLAEAGPAPEGPRPDAEALGTYAWVAPGYVPVGFTNPVRVDADADGVLTPRTPAEAAAASALRLADVGPAPPGEVPADEPD